MPIAPRASGAQPAFCVPGAGGLAAAAQKPFCAGAGGRGRQGSRVGAGDDGHPAYLYLLALSRLGPTPSFFPLRCSLNCQT